MIDASKERLLSMTEAAARVPGYRAGKRTNVATLFRWAKDGSRGVRLETLQFGGRKVTSVEALQRFADRLTTHPEDAKTSGPSVASRQRSAERASQELDALGV